jgi:hypothetical protein
MHTFIDENERFLRLCCSVSRFLGLLLLAYVAVSPPLAIFLYGWSASNFSGIVKIIPMFLFPCLLLLGIDQLIKCLIVSDFKPNWILRFGDKVIYIYACYLFINFVYSYMYIYSGKDSSFGLDTLMISAIFIFIRILIWIGIGALLKRIVPIIQESKTLV